MALRLVEQTTSRRFAMKALITTILTTNMRRLGLAVLGMVLVTVVVYTGLARELYLNLQPQSTVPTIKVGINVSLAQSSPRNSLAASAGESTRSPVGPDELAYVSAFLKEEQLQRYLAGRKVGPQANESICRPIGSDERAYVSAVLSEAQLQRYLSDRQCPPVS
jgi:hypothetical protein